MKICILSANLGSFDKVVDPVKQETEHEVVFHRFTDDNFPPIIGLTPRLQYRIPKMFGWQMMPGYDAYIWLDGSMSFERPDCVDWFVKQLGVADMALFRHPWWNTIREEVEHIEEKLKINHYYITPRYKGGLHREHLEEIRRDKNYVDDTLYASTAFIYRNSNKVQGALKYWWYLQSRYFSSDQVSLPYAVKDVRVNKIMDDIFKTPFLSLVSKHS